MAEETPIPTEPNYSLTTSNGNGRLFMSGWRPTMLSTQEWKGPSAVSVGCSAPNPVAAGAADGPFCF